jgi:dTDP-4-dehydrorhamnose reductase
MSRETPNAKQRRNQQSACMLQAAGSSEAHNNNKQQETRTHTRYFHKLAPKMRVLITGASGFLGQHFLFSLMQTSVSNEIFAIYHSSEGFEEAVLSHKESTRTKNVHFHKLDLTSKDDVDKCFELLKEPFDICYHLAALSSPRVCHAFPERAKLINTPSHFLEKLKDTTIIALSTDQVYDGTSPHLYDEESDEPGPINTYAQTKLDLENLLLSDDSKRTQPTICLRSSIILGILAPFGGNVHNTFLHFCQSRQGQETTFYTDEIRSVINVNDVNHVLLYFYDCMQQGTIDGMDSRVYNMGGSERVSRMEMAAAVAEHCNFQNHEEHFIPAKKTEQKTTSNSVLSPLDISMSSSKLEELVGLKFQGLVSTVKQTFADTSQE